MSSGTLGSMMSSWGAQEECVVNKKMKWNLWNTDHYFLQCHCSCCSFIHCCLLFIYYASYPLHIKLVCVTIINHTTHVALFHLVFYLVILQQRPSAFVTSLFFYHQEHTNGIHRTGANTDLTDQIWYRSWLNQSILNKANSVSVNSHREKKFQFITYSPIFYPTSMPSFLHWSDEPMYLQTDDTVVDLE